MDRRFIIKDRNSARRHADSVALTVAGPYKLPDGILNECEIIPQG